MTDGERKVILLDHFDGQVVLKNRENLYYLTTIDGQVVQKWSPGWSGQRGGISGIGTSAAQYPARRLRPGGAGGSSEGLPPAGRCLRERQKRGGYIIEFEQKELPVALRFAEQGSV